jgi:hypothetical protein
VYSADGQLGLGAPVSQAAPAPGRLTVARLQAINHLGSSTAIYAGERLRVPALTTLFASRVTYNSAGVSGGGIQTSEPEVLSLADGSVVAHNRPDNCSNASC